VTVGGRERLVEDPADAPVGEPPAAGVRKSGSPRTRRPRRSARRAGSQAASASAAFSPNGTIRSFLPLAERPHLAAGQVDVGSERPTSSETRSPVA
jgi:hypothetical protein